METPPTWTEDHLQRIGAAEELQVASRRADGSLSPETTIWAVRAGDGVYVRSAHGWGNGWFQRAMKSGAGQVRAAGIARHVRFELADEAAASAITRAYHSKYDRYGPRIVGTVVSPDAVRAALRVIPVGR